MKVSIIIRTKNEAKRIGEVLELLTYQSEKDFEVIIVDSGSTDQTLEICKSFQTKIDLKIFTLEPNKFTYPFACNFGAQKSHGDFLVFISGHSLPVGKNWLRDGLNNFFEPKVAGIYGNILPSKDATITEFVCYFPGYFAKRILANGVKMGILGNTNSMIRKNLWLEHHFDENYHEGGEDGEWAYYYIGKGFDIIRDPKFAVRHSHGFGFFRYLKQYAYWQRLTKKFLAQYNLS